ncbi:MFS transporter [Streptacidiphilus jiangxiensis]|uniref:Drug resistance transporter, EmrB/QacA subfamily n=1 Tax=Streptacidiphilus jiangxiensis TaxID=235985 RepID=A0A1H7T2M9_STRJI|nr:MFS transporter [Streptacidiphilus jiangxiensis]SEL78536.1 drug resistance transporter, EmrB/QacA subfamily [Streptacidiphilus jiangxiensis]
MDSVGISNLVAEPPTRSAPHRRAAFLVVAAAVFVANLDLFIVNVALPAMQQHFQGSSLATLSWVLNAYAIVFASLLVVAGRLADRVGHRTVFLAGLAVFTAASALCALAPAVGLLDGARVLQAVGAAAMMPTSLALLLDSTPPAERPGAIRSWASIGGIAAGLGPVLGGLLVEADWRWVFVVNVPVGVLALAAGARVLPRPLAKEAGPLPDLLGALLLTAAIGALAVALVKGDEWGWTSARVLGGLLASALLTAWFLRRSAHHPAPVVELPLLRVPAFAAANTAALLFTVAFAGMLLTSVLWCQHAWGYSALRTGLAIAPGPLLVPPVALGSAALVRRLGAGRLAALGTLLFAGGVGWWSATVGLQPHYATELLPGMLFTGLGVGLVLPTLIGAAAASLPPTRFATGSAVTTMARQIGAVLGVAVTVSLLGTPGGPQTALDAFRRGWAAVITAVLLAGAASLALAATRRTQRIMVATGEPAAPAAAAAPID